MEKWKETRDHLHLESRRVEQPVKEMEDKVKLTTRIPGQWSIMMAKCSPISFKNK